MLTSKNDRHMQGLKDAAVTTNLHKKDNVPHLGLIPRLRSERSNKPKQDSFATPASRIKNKKPHCCIPSLETPQTSKKTMTTFKTKSVSLFDLPSGGQNHPKTLRKTVSREQGDDLKPTSIVGSKISNIFHSNNIFNFKSARESELAKYVCQKFILHAWRKRITQTNNLQLVTNSLNKAVANLNIQNCVLKGLLESENNRVKPLTKELNKAIHELQEERKTSNELNEYDEKYRSLLIHKAPEPAKLVLKLDMKLLNYCRNNIFSCHPRMNLRRQEVSFSEDKVLWNSLKIQMEEKMESLKTELDFAVKSSLQLNEKVMNYKQKLDDSKRIRVSLKDKLTFTETSLKDQTNNVNTLTTKCMDLQMAAEGLVTRNQELACEKEWKEKQIREYKNNLKNVEVELNNFQNIQKVQSSDFVKLRKDYEEVKALIKNKDLEIGGLQETIGLYETEEKQLKNKLKSAALRVFLLSLNLIPLPNYIPF